jgi:hypothetical protein
LPHSRGKEVEDGNHFGLPLQPPQLTMLGILISYVIARSVLCDEAIS